MPRLLSILSLLAPAAVTAAPSTLCRVGETSYFDCTTGPAHKVASLCGHDAAPRWLQYRFGRVGEPPELQVPPTTSDAAMASTFFYEAGRRAVGKLESWGVWFRNADTIYELEYVVTEDEDIGPRFAHVVVFHEPSTASPRSLNCASAAGAESLESSFDVIRSMSPPGRSARGSPWDALIADDAAAHKAKDARAASAATR